MPTVSRLAVLPQYLLPKGALTNFAGRVAGAKAGDMTTRLIRWFVTKYDVNMDEAANSDIASYHSFNEFFTRALKPGARPLAKADFVCPVDGRISQFGAIEGDQIFQAKGHKFSTTALVGGDATLAKHFEHGSFANLYLSPRDYHRIHMPCNAVLKRMIYVPGELFSVNPTTARGVPGLFARNERVVCEFDTAFGPFVMVLVGATIVGSMATTWHGVVNPAAPAKGHRVDLQEERVRVQERRRDGPLPARLHRRHAVPERHTALQRSMATCRPGPPGRADGQPQVILTALDVPQIYEASLWSKLARRGRDDNQR